jgi:predicted cupin superfamily sugar epimerase
MKTAQDWIDALALEPHPEGGFFRETYRSPRLLGGRTPISTGIYYLLRLGEVSKFHRITSDEMWHVYAVTPQTRLRIWRLTPEGNLGTFLLGNEPARNESFQDVVPGGDWFAGEVEILAGAPSEAYVLAGCTVSPGFLYSEFELADGPTLARKWPTHADLILRLSSFSDPA